MKFTSVIFAGTLLVSASAASAAPRCETLFAAAAVLGDELDQLARFQIEIDGMSDAIQRSAALEDLRAKFKELVLVSGPDFRERFVARVEALRRGDVDDKKAKDDRARELQTKRDSVLRWTHMTEERGQIRSFLGDQILVLDDKQNFKFYDRVERKTTAAPSYFAQGLSSFDTRAVMSPDQKHVVMLDAARMVVRDLVTGAESVFPKARARLVDDIKFSGDGTKLFISDYMESFEIYEFPSMKIYDASKYTNFSFRGIIKESADGKFVFVDRGTDESILYDVSAKKAMKWPESAEKLAGGFFSPDNRKFVYLNRNGDWAQIDLRTGKPEKSYLQAGKTTNVSEMFVAPNGKFLAIKFSNALKYVTRVYDLTTGQEIKIDFGKFDLKSKNLDFVWARDSLFVSASDGFVSTSTDLYRVPFDSWRMEKVAVGPLLFDHMLADPARDTLYVYGSNRDRFYEIH